MRRAPRTRTASFGRIGALATLGGGLLLAGCGDSASPAPPAPTTPTPLPASVEVSFGAEAVEVYEGDTVEIPVRYESRNLTAAWRLRVSPFPGTAEAADFEIPDAVVEIPPGASASGEIPLSLTGLFDADFGEGTETLTLRFVPDPGVNARLGGDLAVTIREGGALLSFAGEPAGSSGRSPSAGSRRGSRWSSAPGSATERRRLLPAPSPTQPAGSNSPGSPPAINCFGPGRFRIREPTRR